MEKEKIVHIAQTCACFYLRKAAREVTSFYDKHMSKYGLRSTQFVVLVLTYLNQPLRVGELAEQMGLDQTAMSRNLKPLERDGLISIMQDSEDKRAREVSLTKKGEIIVDAASKQWEEAQAEVEDVLTSNGWKALQSTLAKLESLKSH